MSRLKRKGAGHQSRITDPESRSSTVVNWKKIRMRGWMIVLIKEAGKMSYSPDKMLNRFIHKRSKQSYQI